MIEKKYNTLKELFDEVTIIRDKLVQYGADSAATELTEVLECYWTTSSEAIVELLSSFDTVSAACSDKFEPEEITFFQEVRKGAKALLNFE